MKCRICGNEDTEVLTTKLRRGKGMVYYCPYCDYGMLESAFDDAKEYYDKEYRKKFKNDLTVEERESAKSLYEMQKDYQTDRLNIISKYYDENKSFLEIGSSSGQFLSHIIGKFKNISGVELDDAGAGFCKNLIVEMGGDEPDIYTQSIENINWKKDEKFDYIGFFQVLEHIDDLFEFLKCVNDRLKDDGKVFIEVPNLYDPLLKLWDVPAYETFYYHEAHLSYFSEKSLSTVLAKSGFKVEEMFYLQDYNLLNNLFWYFNNKPQESCIFGLNKPHIEFRDEAAGKEVNALFEKMNKEYFEILARHKMTSNMFCIASKQ